MMKTKGLSDPLYSSLKVTYRQQSEETEVVDLQIKLTEERAEIAIKNYKKKHCCKNRAGQNTVHKLPGKFNDCKYCQ